MKGRYQQVIIDSLPYLSIGGLKAVGLFNQREKYKCLPVTLSQPNGLITDTCSMNVTVSIQEQKNSYILLDYVINNLPVNYCIPLTQVRNSLTKGFTWYFVCPVTNRKARKLYLSGNHFQHRTATNGYYLRDTLSKFHRRQYETMKRIRSLEKIVAGRGKRYFKSTYACILTKRQLRVTQANAELKEKMNLYLQS